jgi:hypothetical protein
MARERRELVSTDGTRGHLLHHFFELNVRLRDLHLFHCLLQFKEINNSILSSLKRESSKEVRELRCPHRTTGTSSAYLRDNQNTM